MSNLVTRATKGSALTHNEMDTNWKQGAQTKATVYTIAEGDNRDTIEYSGTGSEAFTLPDAATIAAAADTGDFEVTIKHVGTGTLSVTCLTGTDTIDGSTSDVTLEPQESRTFKLDQAGTGYNVIANTGLVVIDDDTMATASSTTLATSESIVEYVNSRFVLESSITLSAGSTFTGIPSWAKRVTVMFDGLSIDLTNTIDVQIGDSGGLETTGYLSSCTYQIQAGANGSGSSSDGFLFAMQTAATCLINGSVVLSLMDSSTNTWIASGTAYDSNDLITYSCAGSKSLSSTLTQVKLYLSTSNFDAGTMSISYE